MVTILEVLKHQNLNRSKLEQLLPYLSVHRAGCCQICFVARQGNEGVSISAHIYALSPESETFV